MSASKLNRSKNTSLSHTLCGKHGRRGFAGEERLRAERGCKWRSGLEPDFAACTIPCPCTFAHAPSEGDCEGILAWHVREGNFGDVRLEDLNVVALGTFEGDIWAGQTKATMGIYMDERADDRQREALQMIFGGQVGGWPGEFGSMIGEVRGIEFVSITFEIADDLAYWAAEVPGKASARAEALTGPTAPPGQRVQVHNPPGAEVGPGQVATWGRATADRADGFGFKVGMGRPLEQALPL